MRIKWDLIVGLIACVAAGLEAGSYDTLLKRYERQIREQERQLRGLQTDLANKDRQARLWEEKAGQARTRWQKAKSAVEDARQRAARYKTQRIQAHAQVESAQWSALERASTVQAANGQLAFLTTELYKFQQAPHYFLNLAPETAWQRRMVEQLAAVSQSNRQLAETARQQEATFRVQETRWLSAEQQRMRDLDREHDIQQSQWFRWQEALERRANLQEEKHHLEESAQALRVMLQDLRDHRDQSLTSRSGSTPSPNALKALRASLPWPATGRVTQTFGRQYSTDLQQWVISNGIKIEADPGRVVRAVAPGKVLFSRPFQDYGPLVIIQHLNGVTSVYGELGEMRIKEGAVVAALSPIGVVGDRRAFYFELRYNEEPINPLICLGPTHHTEISLRRAYP